MSNPTDHQGQEPDDGAAAGNGVPGGVPHIPAPNGEGAGPTEKFTNNPEPQVPAGPTEQYVRPATQFGQQAAPQPGQADPTLLNQTPQYPGTPVSGPQPGVPQPGVVAPGAPQVSGPQPGVPQGFDPNVAAYGSPQSGAQFGGAQFAGPHVGGAQIGGAQTAGFPPGQSGPVPGTAPYSGQFPGAAPSQPFGAPATSGFPGQPAQFGPDGTPPKKGRGKLIGMIVAAVVVVAAIAGAVYFFAFRDSGPSESDRVATAASDFADALTTGDTEAIAALMCTDEADSFRDSLGDPAEKVAPKTAGSESDSKETDDSEKFEVTDVRIVDDKAEATLKFSGDERTTQLYLKNEDGWKVCAPVKNEIN